MALSGEQVEKVRLTLQTSGWNDVMQPLYAARSREAIKALCLTPGERAGPFKDLDDNALRGIIRECEWMLNVWANEIKVFEHNQRIDEMERSAKDGAASSAR